MRSWWHVPMPAVLAALAFMLACPLPGRAEPAAPARSVTVGFAQDTLGNDWRRAQQQGLAAAFAAHPEIRFLHTDAEGSTAQQIQDIEDLVARGVDLLITSPRDAELMAPVIDQVAARGIPVVLLSRRTTSEAHTVFIRGDNRDIGRRAAARLAERMGGRGRVLVLQGIPSSTSAIERTAGFLEALREHPGMEVAAVKSADYLRGKAIMAVDEVLGDGVPFDAIFAQSDGMASGARAALRRAGIDPLSRPTVGVDYIQEAREAIRVGEQDASFVHPTFAREGAEAALRILRGETVPREIVVEAPLVTRDNVDRVEPIF